MLPCNLSHATRFSVLPTVERLPIRSGKDLVLKGNKMNWAQEKAIYFIEEFRKLAVLWDISMEEYKNNNAKPDIDNVVEISLALYGYQYNIINSYS